MRDDRVFFLSDGTTTFDMGGATAGELQKATLARFPAPLFGEVLTVDEMVEKIRAASMHPSQGACSWTIGDVTYD